MSMPVIQGSPKKRKAVWSLPFLLAVIGGGLVLVCGCLGLLMAPALLGGRDAAQRMQAGNCVKQIVLAVQNYADANGGLFPPAVVVDEQGKPLYSGRVLLLPYLEQQALYAKFDKTKAWDSPENLQISQTTLLAFESPKNRGRKPGQCDFVFVSGPGTAFDGSKSIGFGDIIDGSSGTLLVIESTKGPPSWAAPGDWDASSGPIPPGFHKDLTVVGFADGRVQKLKTNPPHPDSRALCTIAGREPIELDY
jgi:hypothetical protein